MKKINEESQYNKLYRKYKQVAKTKAPYQISDNILTPTMGEMIEEDLSYEAILDTIGDIDKTGDPKKAAFYVESPFRDEVGYDPDLDAMLIDAPVKKHLYNGVDVQWAWNLSDGDTLTYKVKEVNMGTEPFKIDGKFYMSFEHYFYANSKKTSNTGTKSSKRRSILRDNEMDDEEVENGDEDQKEDEVLFEGDPNFVVRFVGINCAEVPHFEVQYIKKSSIDARVVKKRFGDIKNNKSYNYWKYPTTDKYDFDYEYKERDDDEILLFMRSSESNVSFHEIVRHSNKSKQYKPVPTGNIDDNKDLTDVLMTDFKLDSPDDEEEWNEEKDVAFLVLAKDESVRENIADAYKSQKLLKELLEKSGYKTRLVLDCKTVNITDTYTSTGKALYSIFYAKDLALSIVEQMNKDIKNLRLSGYSYGPYGTDVYGRYLSAIYVNLDDKWINANKYVLANTEYTIPMPDYYDKPEITNKILSDAFKIWSYDFDRFLWIDSFEELNQESYDKRIKLHEELLGMSFCEMRSNTVLIGDTLMIIPPTNIRSVTQTTYEKTPLLRSKGQMVKGGNHNESILEMTLFFAGDAGINGIPYEVTLPSGEKTKYYMNGLRSLIAQFKLTPFLPIENEYINDVLNIEAVSLLNIEVNTVPEYPKMLQATLTVRAFNYRIFMPDLPLGITEENNSDNPLSELNPIFAKAFQWEVFRYYYQRLILAGETLHGFTYNTAAYNEYLYRGITALKPTMLCNSNISFYIPDIDWLDKALIRKKESDEAVVDFNEIELSEETRKFANMVGEHTDKIIEDIEKVKDKFNEGIGNSDIWNDLQIADHQYLYFVNEKYLEGKTRLKARGKDNVSDVNVIKEYVQPIQHLIERTLLKTGLFTQVYSRESYSKDSDETGKESVQKVLWTISAKLSNNLTEKEKSELKEFLLINLGVEEKEMVFENDCVNIYITIVANEDGDIYDVVYSDSMFNSTLRNLKKIGEGKLTSSDKVNVDEEDYNYRDPSKMPFVPLVQDVTATEMSISLSNLFTETKLKAVDGISGQYVGGQDSSINIRIITCDRLVVASISALQDISFQFTNDYRRIMACTPIRIKSDFTQLYGINEVAIDMIDINTIDKMPGAYEINLKLSSLDRTIRQRESLRKMNFSANGGFVGSGEAGKQSTKTYFELNDVLSKVELYPDLEIPTLDELRQRGYAYIRYNLSNTNRAYPDPDFYMVYSNSYSAAIIKAQIKNFFDELNNPEVDTEKLEEIVLSDSETGEAFFAKLDEAVGLSLIGQNEVAELTSEELKNIEANVFSIENEKNDKAASNRAQKDTEKALKYILASNVTDGWQLKPKWAAPLCDPYTNNLIKMMPKKGSEESKKEEDIASDDHSAAKKIKSTRRRLIEAIDNILSEPIDIPMKIKRDIESHNTTTQSNKIFSSIKKKVNEIFVKNKDGKEIIELLNPLKDNYTDSPGTNHNSNMYANPNMINWITGFIFSSACTNSSVRNFEKNILNVENLKLYWGPRMWYNEGVIEKTKDVFIPLCLVDGHNIGLPPGKIKDAEEKMIDAAIENGNVFGPFGIQILEAELISNLMKPMTNIKYVSEENYNLYKDNKINTGFIDPYYNRLDADDDKLIKYKKGIMLNSEIASEAFIRTCLVWLRKLILDGLFISEIDVLAEDLKDMFTKNSSIFENGKLPNIDSDNDDKDKQIKKVIKAMNDNLLKSFFDIKDVKKDTDKKEDISDLYLILASLSDLLPKSFCARMIYPIYLAATNGSPFIYNEMKDRNYDGLQSAVSTSLSGKEDDVFCKELGTFFSSMAGQGMIDITDPEKSWTDLGQKMANSLNKEVYLEFSNNPKIYTMHSYYDMLMNDKRGRLVRAFPSYYMILIDEGRKIGYWKLHDNFYNMSAISDIQVVKSRKIAADTATVTMTNTYNSYATEHDNSTKYKYADLYGVRDVFDSIFSPKRYYDKVDDIRQTAKLKDTVVLKPGVRMHIRMGYSADAARMPVMFNGRIAEVNAGEVVNIIAQGDGIEVTNPLNNLGNIETNHIDTVQSIVFPKLFTNMRGSWSKGGLSPRNQLSSILSAEYGGLNRIVNELSNGRFFNNNPFGLLHFGDMRFKEIFEEGEVAQNLFEVTDDDLLPGMNVIGKDSNTKFKTPIINTSLYDKTFWDLMHISARAGKDYVSAIRDFDFRSTIFLGQHNHYYAYGYKIINGNIYEKRKPFQQYHYIEPYNDIIYNTIKASEQDIKTNAVGIWQATNMTFGRKTSTVGPLYLDINIYPEYQKSMTYDTGLLADGNGGIDINPITKLGESHMFAGKGKQDDKTYDDKVNVKLAERMTINALKDSIKDMYQGEVTIIGSPAIKPHDRVHIYDHHEDMFGDVEVETVIHSLNAYTGFTTTIHPDLIVRHRDNDREIAAQKTISLLSGVLASSIATYSYVNLLSKVQTKLLTNVINSSAVSFATGGLSSVITKNPIFTKNLDKLDSKTLKNITEALDKIYSGAGNISNNIYMKGIKGITDNILKMNITKDSSPKDVIKYFKMLEDFNINSFNTNIESAIKNAKLEGIDVKDIEAVEDLAKEINSSYKKMASEIDMTDFFQHITKDEKLSKALDKIDNKLFEELSKEGFKLNNQEGIKRFNKIMQSDEIFAELIKEESELFKLFKKGIDPAIDFASDKATKGGFKAVSNLFLKGENVFKALAVKIKSNPLAMNIVSFIISLVISETIGLVSRTIFKTWFDSLQTLTIYPMKQYGKSFTAGINGAKACTYGAPPEDGWNSIQGMVIKAFDIIENMNPALRFVVRMFTDSLLASSTDFKVMSQGYRENLGLVEKTELTESDIVNNVYDSISNNMDRFGTNKQAVMYRSRIQNFDKTNKNTRTSLNYYAIKNLKPNQIATEAKLSKLVALDYYPDIQSYIKEGKLKIAHSIAVDASTINLRVGGKDKPIKVLPTQTKDGVDNDKLDMPLLQNDAAVVLKSILDETYLDDEMKHVKYVLHSGTVINTDGWESTGFRFILEANDKAVVDKFKKVQKDLEVKFKVFDFTKSNGYYVFKVYPPTKTS